MENIIKKIYKICKSSENRISEKRLQCDKCRRLKYPVKNDYYKNYYLENKDKILINQYDLYHNKYKNSKKNLVQIIFHNKKYGF